MEYTHRLKKTVYLSIVLFVVITPARAYISKFGKKTLQKCQYVVQGSPQKDIELARGGGTLISFLVKAVYKGKISLQQKIHLLYLQAPTFKKGEQWVVFLTPLSSTNTFRVQGEFSLEEADGQAKLKTLKQIFKLELIPDPYQKQQAYLTYCLQYLADENPWIRHHAFREWEYFENKYPNLLKQELLPKLQKTYQKIPEIFLRKQIKKSMVRIRMRLLKKQRQQKTSMFVELISPKIIHAKKILSQNSLQPKIKAICFLGNFPCISSQKILINALQDPSPHIRSLASFYLGMQGARIAGPNLAKLLKNEKYLRVCRNIIFALGRINYTQAISDIKKYKQYNYTRATALRVLKKLKPTAK